MSKSNKRRYLTVYLRPNGSEHLGTGADRACFHYYANIQNVIRFGLARDNFPAGQYHIYDWPEGRPCPEKPVMIAHKRV